MVIATAYSIFLSEVSIRTIAVFLAVFLTLYVFFKRQKHLPPSPGWSWPVVGHLLSLGRAPHLKLTEWSKQCGDVYTIRMGMEDVVVLNGYRAIKEAFVDCKDAFSSRPDVHILNLVFGEDLGFLKFGKAYKAKRKFAFNAMRTLGMKMGPNSAEEHVRDEALQLCSKLSEQVGPCPLDMTHNLNVSTANTICSMVFGKRYDYDDRQFVDLSDATGKLAVLLGSCQFIILLPFLRFIPGVNSSYKCIMECSERIITFTRNELTKHFETFDSENPRDFIDLIIAELKSHQNTSCLTEENIQWTVQDLFLGGFETTSTTLRWILLYMVLYPEEQQKVQAELDSVLGKDPAVPTMAQRPQLPYTEATIMEVMRIRGVTAINFPRATAQDTVFRGYVIPEGTKVLANIWSAHHDPEYWPDPEKYDPHRFLDSEGRVIRRPESFLPFSAGRRECLGQLLARMEIFLIFSALLKHFTFKLPEGAAKPSTDGSLGVALTPPTVKMCITER